MRVGIVFEYSTLNGGERSMLAALDGMGSERPEIIAIGLPHGPLADELRKRSIEIIPLSFFGEDSKRLPRDQTAGSIAEATRDLGLDVLHANSLSMGVLCGELSSPPFVRVAHIRDIMSLSQNAVRLLNQTDRLLAVSQATRKYHVGQGVDANRVTVLHNGVDCTQFQPQVYPRTLRRELHILENRLLSLTVGQIGLRKGLEVLVEAICDIGWRLPDLDFAIAGQRSSSKPESIEYEQNLYRLLEENQMDARVHWLGYRTDVAHLMNEADMLVHVAHQEPLGRVLLEAAASALPIVATKVGGTEEILKQDESALLVDKGNANQVASAIAKLAGSPALRTRLGTAARNVIEERFLASDAARQLREHWVAASERRS